MIRRGPRWNGIRRVRPEQARQIVQRDADPPAVWRSPYEQRDQQDERDDAGRAVIPGNAEIHDRDAYGDRQSVAHDREEPGIAGIPFEDEAADRTPFDVPPAGEQRSDSAVRALSGDAASKRRADRPETGVGVTRRRHVPVLQPGAPKSEPR